MTRLSRSRRAPGFTLLEFILVVTFMIAASILVFYHSDGAKIAATVEREVSTYSTATGRIKNIFSGKGGYAGINNAVLVSAQVFSSEKVTGTDVRHAWGGTIVVAPSALGGQPNVAYAWTMENVPQAECIELTSAVDSMVLEVRVNSVVVKPFMGALDRTLLADATACSATSGDNQVVFVTM